MPPGASWSNCSTLTATRSDQDPLRATGRRRGGSDQALLRLVRSLPRGEFDFHIALPGPSPLAAEFAAAGATLHVVPMQRLSTSHGAGEWGGYVAGWPVAVARLDRARPPPPGRPRALQLAPLLVRVGRGACARPPHVVHAREIVVQSRCGAARRAGAVPPLRDARDRGLVRGRCAARPRERRRARRVPRSRRVLARARRRVPRPGRHPRRRAARRRGRAARSAEGARRAARRVRDASRRATRRSTS